MGGSITASPRKVSILQSSANYGHLTHCKLHNNFNFRVLHVCRTDIQCREKWTNNLDPSIVHTDFTPEEDDILIKLVERLLKEDKEGKSKIAWSKVSRFMPGRTDYMLRKRWILLSGISNDTSDNELNGKPSSFICRFR